MECIRRACYRNKNHRVTWPHSAKIEHVPRWFSFAFESWQKHRSLSLLFNSLRLFPFTMSSFSVLSVLSVDSVVSNRSHWNTKLISWISTLPRIILQDVSYTKLLRFERSELMEFNRKLNDHASFSSKNFYHAIIKIRYTTFCNSRKYRFKPDRVRS